MSAQSKQKIQLHAISTLQILNECRKNNLLCDFTLLVNNTAFRMHRVVLASCSKYFNAMFSHDTQELRNGISRMPGLETEAMNQCIEFMYTGQACPTLENAQPILHASCLLHLHGLTELCFEILIAEIRVDSCLYIKRIAQTYNGKDLEMVADKFVLANFDSVIIECGFVELKMDDLIRYIKSPEIVISSVISLWQATLKWICHEPGNRKEHMCDLLQYLKLEDYPEMFIRVTIWQDVIIQESDICKSLVAEALFKKVVQDPTKDDTVNVQSCLFIKALGREYSCAEAEKLADEFILKNFDDVIDQRGFRLLDKVDVIRFIRSPDVRYSSEVNLWKAVVAWIKHDLPKRKTDFSEMLKYVKLEKMSSDFLQNTVRKDDLVKSSDVCKDMLMDALFRQVTKEKKYGIAVVDRCSKVLKSYDPSARQWHDSENVKISFPLIDSFVFAFVIEKHLFVLIKNSLHRIPWREKQAKWTEMASMNTKHDSGSATTLGRYIYVIDGRSVPIDDAGNHDTASKHGRQPRKESSKGERRTYSCGECYDSLLNSWSHVDMMSVPRTNCSLTSCEDMLYLIGGKMLMAKESNWLGMDTPTNIAEYYEPVSKSWMDMAPMQIPRYDSAATSSNGIIFVLGGFGQQGRLKDVEAFDTVTKGWSVISQMSVTRSHFSACVVDGAIYAVGGDYRKDAYDKTIECFDQHKRKWEIVNKLNLKIYDNAAFVLSLEQ